MVVARDRSVATFRYLLGMVAWLLLVFSNRLASAQEAERCLAVEFYYRSGEAASDQALALVKKQFEDRRGIRLVMVDVERNESRVARLRQIADYFKLEPDKTPLLYATNRAVQGFEGEEQYAGALQSLTRMEVYVRAGCPRCARAKEFLPSVERQYPGLEIVYYEISGNAANARRVHELTREYGQAAASVPIFHFCRRLIVGFDSAEGTGQRIQAVLRQWSHPCQMEQSSDPRTGQRVRGFGAWTRLTSIWPSAWIGLVANSPAIASADGSIVLGEAPPDSDEAPPLLPLPGEMDEGSEGESYESSDPPIGDEKEDVAPANSFEAPLLGRLSPSDLGLPLFTVVIGLVDGFNPCAMWVLLFLLSILVNLRSRAKIIAVAGTFVFISGLFYFAFMAAWLNVFKYIEFERRVQIALGSVAVLVGLIHIKDFFAYKRGVSLSIPESAKPGIYDRARRIVTAENLFGAIVGASILAAMVNFIELLCTAGLPALYTGILSSRQLPTWQYYAYLLLYNLAYMFDDALMVAITVATLSKTKMQEHHGRVLKLVGGTVILALGAVMIVRPKWII